MERQYDREYLERLSRTERLEQNYEQEFFEKMLRYEGNLLIVTFSTSLPNYNPVDAVRKFIKKCNYHDIFPYVVKYNDKDEYEVSILFNRDCDTYYIKKSVLELTKSLCFSYPEMAESIKISVNPEWDDVATFYRVNQAGDIENCKAQILNSEFRGEK